MTVKNVEQDLNAGTLTLTAEFAAPIERVWQLLEDPRMLEQWWGPPTYPATFDDFEFASGGSVGYYMTGPDGSRYYGYWQITSINPPKLLEFVDGFAHDDRSPNAAMPVTSSAIELSDLDGGTRMQIRSTAASGDDLQKLVEMGMVEGLSAAVGQMDALLAG